MFDVALWKTSDDFGAKPYRLHGTCSTGTGCVAPAILQFNSPEDAEIVADRYRATYPEQTFRVIKVNRYGYARA